MIGYHLVRLVRFSGRESRARFWPWAGTVIGLIFVGAFIGMIPLVLRSMATMRRFVREHPEMATVSSSSGRYEVRIEGYHPELIPDVGPFLSIMEGALAVAIVLLAAAIVRRLHDTGRTGAWGLLPLPFLYIGFVNMPAIFAAPVPDMRLLGLLFINNLTHLAAVGVLVVLLSRPGKVGGNRYGPPSGD